MSPDPTHLNVIITGATGMVGEGVLLTCLDHPAIAHVLLVSRKPYTDSSEKGRVMWARVKGRTENALTRLGFRGVYNFRPGFMRATPGQKNLKSAYNLIGWAYPLLRLLLPNMVSTLHDVAIAMIRCVQRGYPKQILEVKDINALANS